MALNYYIGIFFCGFLGCFAQQDSAGVQRFKPFNDNITAKLSINTSSNSFGLTDTENNITYNMFPNDRQRIDLALSYRSIALSVGFAPNFLAMNKDNGDSKFQRLNVRAFYKRWTQSFNLYNQKGFNLEVEDQQENQQVVLPAVKTFKIGGQTSYVLNRHFSFRAMSAQSEWQQKSAGSLVPTLSLYYTKIKGFEETVQTYTAALSPAYYYNFVIRKNFFISLGVLPGLGIEYADSNTSDLYQMELTLALGYNSNTFFAGINSNGKYFGSNRGSNVIWNDNISNVEIYLGYRFKPPKKLAEISEKINQKLFKKN
ncbi:MAG TPA: DUF4421 family protein [Flavobacterium sp.]|nr:DUF4421 family protein [Flavobacterium sp.]